jgi:hypothetical protein
MTKDEALRMALEALEQLQGGCTDHDDGTFEAITVWCPEVIDAIKQALAAPTFAEYAMGYAEGFNDGCKPAPVQEPVAWRTYTGRGYYIIDLTFEEAQKNWPDRRHQPLYTNPPAAKRQWVGLTDEEIQVVLDNPQKYYDTMNDFARTIEAKLKERNQ